MRVALVSAPYDTRAFRVGENLGVKYLAAVVEAQGGKVTTIEPALSGLDEHAIIHELLAEPYDLIGFSVMFDSALAGVARLVRRLRAEGCSAHITIGGHVPTFSYHELLASLPELDTVVRFEGEGTLVELLENLDQPDRWQSIRGLVYRELGEIRANTARDLIDDLDCLPFPRRDKTSRHLGDPHFFVVTTRGCPFTCTFCSVPAFYREPRGRAWRARSVGNVIAELAQLKSEWGAAAISFLDDEFLVGRNGKQRASQLAAAMRHHGLDLAWSFECRADDVDDTLFADLRAGGLRHVFIGIESGVQRVLDSFQKRTTVAQNRKAIQVIRELDLSLAVGFIMYDPYTTTDELRANVSFLRDTGIATYKTTSNKVLVYRGTQVERQLEREGRLIVNGLTRDFRFVRPEVDLAYRLSTRCLEQWHQVDQDRRRVEFLLDTMLGGVSTALRARYDRIAQSANELLCDVTEVIIDYVGQQPEPRERMVERFASKLRDEVADEVRSRRRDLRQMRDQLLLARRAGESLEGVRIVWGDGNGGS